MFFDRKAIPNFKPGVEIAPTLTVFRWLSEKADSSPKFEPTKFRSLAAIQPWDFDIEVVGILCSEAVNAA